MSLRLLIATVLAAAVCAAGAVEAADALVLESTDPAFAPGAVIRADEAITIASGATLTLLGEDGSTRRLDGPFAGTLPAAGQDTGEDLIDGLANLFGTGGVDSQAFGAVRGGDATAAPDDPWVLDMSGSGHRCVGAAQPRGMWRATADRGYMRALAGGGDVAVAWNTPASVVPWPSEMRVVDGGDYAFLTEGAGGLAHVTIHRVPAVFPSDGHLLRWLAEQGCTQQARALLARMVAQPEPLTLSLDTPLGPAPVLRVGDALAIRLATNRDAYVHCVYGQADGTVIALFPNRFTGGPRVAGHVDHAIPSARDGLTLTLGGPAGTESIHCFAWTDDPAGQLPDAVGSADITRPYAETLDVVVGWMEASAPAARATLSIELRE